MLLNRKYASMLLILGSANLYALDLGIELHKSRFSLKENYGKKVFIKNPTFYNVFATGSIVDDFGFEVGYQQNFKSKKRY